MPPWLLPTLVTGVTLLTGALGFIWREIKASEARQEKALHDLQNALAAMEARQREELKASEARQREEMKASEARQREEMRAMEARQREDLKAMEARQREDMREFRNRLMESPVTSQA